MRVYQFRHIRAGGHCSLGSPGFPGSIDVLARGRILLLAVVAALAVVPVAPAQERDVEVVVTLAAPPLAGAVSESRALSDAARTRRLDLSSPTSVAYLDRLDHAQRALERRITAAIPSARVRWRYGVVANGFAVVVPPHALQRLARVPGVARVYPNLRYHSLLDRSPQVIGAPALWGPNLTTAGQGMKIGVIDDGLDQSHPFFSGAGYSPPAGFPKGQRAYTTAKVIAARAFPPISPTWKHAAKPFDPEFSEHATHVAGIAAGNHGFTGLDAPNPLSGIAPRAFLGNYKVLTIPTVSGAGLDGNSAEIVAGIEAAVRDGMDVINLSLGEPEIDQARDIVVAAIDRAADAGVVPAIAAGNDFDTFGRGSIGSPGSSPNAITAAAATKASRIAEFSSGGPTPVSLQLKPDVTAPGVSILSSVPLGNGGLAEFSGTSMASPHVAGAAALLRQRHPTWTVAQIKSALVLTGVPVYQEGTRTEVSTTREGGGMINLPRADAPLVFASPTRISLGVLKRGDQASESVRLTDAGDGAGEWAVQLRLQRAAPGVAFTLEPTVQVPGRLQLAVRIAAAARDREVTGFVILRNGQHTRRIPVWLRVAVPVLGREPHGTLARTGVYSGNTRGKAMLVARYRYPEGNAQLSGPEQVFRVQLRRPAANFGVVITSRGNGVRVEPRVVFAGDENHLTGYPALPLNLNPYLPTFLEPELVAGAIRPAAGSYDVVFDSRARSTAGAFTFRFWINDQTPPRVQVLSRTLNAGGSIKLRATDAGSGVDPTSVAATLDQEPIEEIEYDDETGDITIPIGGLGRGRHALFFQISDYQEAKNMENVAPILPNTRQVRAIVVVQ